MGAEPLPSPARGAVVDGTSGDEQAELIRASAEADRAEEMALLRRKLDGAVIFAAGPANVVLQLSWPEVGYGVVESKVESGRTDKHPFKRFRTTIGYLGIALMGSDEQRLAYREAINGQHRQVRSTPESPVKYNAFNRELQLWVASCLYYGSIDAMTRMHGPMTYQEQVVMLRAGARMGTTLQLPEEMWHRTPEEFWAYWEDGIARADIDEVVGEYLRRLLQVRMLKTPLGRAAGTLSAWVNTGFLPAPLREQLGLAWSEKDQRRHDRMLRRLGLVTRRLPHVVRSFPINAMVGNIEIRRRLGKPLV
ncbi:oxygenase MpaB family protein [Nocardioides stalactiti]|uniref:oxygenase MpaB family protein n=1 Tax=Nocardioides stalactiti TaxID=2755356 RepID=UPI0016020044|nr:oxygenase MpaB family protein [Nocardioides stalactiti]